MINKQTLVAIAGLTLAPFVSADMAGIEVGAYQWTPDYSGTIKSDSTAAAIDAIDIQDSLGFTDDTHNIIWASLEHPVPVIPNIKIVSSDLNSTASNVLTEQIEFEGEVFSASETVDTVIDLSNIEYTLYYELLDNWINLDGGITIRDYDGVVSLNTDPAGSNIDAHQSLNFMIPLIYVKGRVDLPFTGFFVDGEINIISIDGNSLSDTAFSVGYESEIGLGAKAGFRTFSMDVDESDLLADVEFKGAYISAFFHF
ncbi:MAG: TIGR04219 family outer membrane beta-barrel protein [Kangiellaceae bacterium]